MLEVYNLAVEQYNLAEDQEGQAKAESAAATITQQKEIWQEATALRGQAAKLLQDGDFAEASTKFQEAEEVYMRCDNATGANRARQGCEESEARRIAQELAVELCNDADSLITGKNVRGSTYHGAMTKYTKAEVRAWLCATALGETPTDPDLGDLLTLCPVLWSSSPHAPLMMTPLYS